MEQTSGFNMLTFFITIYILNCLSPFVAGFKLIAPRNQQSYARFPKWNACTNATLSFDFKTKAENGTLMYTDDHGKFDFFDMRLVNGKAKLRLNIVDGKDGSVEFEVGNNLNDYKWHTVKIERNRMETTFSVDQESMRKLSYGSDFYFGSLENNSDVFFGGLPNSYMKNLKDLALPSVMFLPKPRLEIRNVIYGNCSCKSVRGRMIEGVSLDKRYTEACDQRNPCGDCLCISTDSGPKCQCDDSNRCTAESTGTFYHLPMNAVVGTTAVNPSGLDATVNNKPAIVRGAIGNALQIDGKRQYLQVTGPGHRYECFGDLDRCKDGYTLGFWVKFSNTGNSKGVYLSNGGHSAESHGVAMMYKKGELEFAFRKRDGKYWNVKDKNLLEDKWYHVMVTWKNDDGLYLYVNGILTDEDSTPEQRASLSREPKHNLFYVGRANDKTGIDQLGILTIDDFKFWSEFKDRYSIIEDGPMYRYHLDMDEMEGYEMVSSNVVTEVFGDVRLVPGKIKNAVRFSKDGGNIAIDEMSDTCLVEPALCIYGFTISFWLKLLEFGKYSYLFSSKGINIYTVDNTLHTDVSAGNKKWSDNFYGLETNKWHFVEVTWNPEKGVSMYLDLRLASRQKGHTIENQSDSKDDKFYIGRANMAPTQEFPNAVIDEVEMWYGERDSLLFLDLIQRGKPNKFQFGLDKKVGDRLFHPALLIDTYQNPKIVPGKIGNAIKLNGEKQYVDFGEHGNQCLGNLDLCHHGALTAFWFNPTNFKNNMYFFSSGENGITVKNQGNSLKVTAATTTQEWDITTDILQPNQWYFLEISFDPEKGLILYVNNNAVAKDNNPAERRNTGKPSLLSQSTENKFYLGRGNTYMQDGDYGEATFDELEYWYGPRDYLIAFDYLQRGKPESLIIDMEEKKGSRILNQDLDIRTYGDPSLVQGVVGNALYLDGNNQYIDLGDLKDQCLGNLQECSNGITVSTWLNFKQYLDNMYILSTGNNGIRLYQKGGEIIAVVHQNGKEWEVKIPRFDTDIWNYLELSWHPDFGLNMYVNNTLVGHSSFKNVPPVAPIRNSRVYIGRSNTGDSSTRTSTAKMTVDETEVWYGRREELLAFDYILRDNIEHETFSMERSSSGVILHPKFRITLANGAKLAPGKIGNAVLLDGFGQYVDLGYHGDICMGNLEKCKNGLTISLWFKARELEDNTYILSGPSYSLSYKDKKLVARFHANGKMWEVASPNIYADRWHNIIMTWDPTKGLGLFIDGQKSGSSSSWSSFQGDDPSTKSVFIGRSNDDSSKTVKGLVDEVQFFYGPVDPLLSSGQLSGYVNHQSLPFDKVIRYENGNYKIVLPTRTVLLHGGVTTAPGLHSSAIRVNGKSQYLDLGDDLICGGNLDKCDSRGFTVQLSIRPESLFENMYFLDSFPLSVYYRNGRLFATARTPAKSWTVSWPEFAKNKWQLVELTWQPERGLTMFVNGDETSHQTIGTPQNEVRNWSKKTYLGRSLNDMVIERYADATIERMDVWNAHRDYLTINGLEESISNVSIVETVSVPERPTINVTRPRPDSDVTWINIDGQGHGINRRPIAGSRRDVDIMVIKNITGHADALNKTQNCQNWKGEMASNGQTFEPRKDNPCYRCLCTLGQVGECYTASCQTPTCRNYTIITGTCCQYRCHDRDNRANQNNTEININNNRESNRYNLTWTLTNKGDRGRGTTQRSIIDERTSVSHRTQRIETNIIRFSGDAYIHYDIAHFGSQQPRMLEQVSNETFYFQFITKEANGLIWMDTRSDVEMFLAIKNGFLTFAIREGNGAFREVRLQAQGVRDLNDWRWHMFKIERNGRVMRFFLDDIYAGQITTSREIQLIAAGDIYLGGSPDNHRLTAQFIDNSFDGAITEVIYTKYASRYRITIVSLLAHINLGTQHGNIIIYRPGEFERPHPTTTRAPVTPRPTYAPTTRRPPPKRVLVFRTVSINQYKAQFYISGNLDLREGGQINFRFRTLHSDGLLFFSGRKGAGNSIPAFISFEIIDKILYFVYDFGSGTKRVAISNDNVSTGAWRNIRMDFSSRQLVIYLDNRPIRIDMAAGHLRTLYLNDGLRFGDISDQGVSWYIWARDGYIGCIADFEMINVLTNIPNLVTFPSFPGVSNQCVDVTRYCDSASVCGAGSCLYRHDNQYFCYCAGTGFAGRNCDEWPVTGVFEGHNHITYNYATYQTSHSNDISVRFQTAKRNAFLFQTYSTRGYDEFIRGELHNGRIRVTVRLNGQNQVFYVGENLNDQDWHTFNLRRRGNSLEMWIDDLTHKKETLQGNNFLLHYDKIYFGSMGDLSVSGIHPNFVGYLHNVYFDRIDIFNLLKTYTGGKYPHWILREKDFHTYMLRPVTFTSHDSHIQMSTLSITDNLHIMFNFKTSQPDGIILFNKGQGNKFIAIELIDGHLYFKFNNGIGKDSVTKLLTNKLSDNQWHTFEVKEVLRGLQRQYQLKVDGNLIRNVAIVGNSKLDLVGSLYIGGLSLAMLNDRFVQKVLSSKHGFMGCMASIMMNGNSVDIVPYASQSQFIREGCVDVAACPLNACQNGGICLPGVPSYSCNCHLTAYWGADCSSYPNGSYFGRQEPENGGLISYVLDILQNSNKDEIALGFMTYYSDGILYRMESGRANEYIEIRLEDGHIVAEYNTGNGIEFVRLDTVRYDDGGYHVLKFVRTGEESLLIVDGLTAANTHKGIHSMFDQIQYIYIGGYTGSSGQGIMNKFTGIIGGVYWNGHRFIDIAHNPKNDKHIEIHGDVFLINEKEYILYKPVKPVRPAPFPLPPEHGPYNVPPHIGGGGVVGPGLSGEGGTGPGLTGVGGGGGGISSGGGGFVGVGGGAGPITAPQIGGAPPIPPPAGGGGVRAGALMGTILGTMAFLASVMWAFWQCKPGMITCPGGGGGGGAPPPSISPPTATNLPVAQALGGVGGGGGAGSGSAKITVVNGSASGGGAGGGSGGGVGGGSSMVSNYQSSTQQFSSSLSGGAGGGGGGFGAGGGSSGFAAGGGGGGFSAGYGSSLSEVDSSTLRATGTFSNKGTSIGTPKATRSFFGSASAAGGGAGGGGGNTSYMYQSETTTYRGGGGGGGGGSGTLGYGESTTADYDMAIPSANYQSNTLSSSVGGSSGYGGGGGTMSKGGYSTMSSSYNYQVQNMRTMMANQGTYQMTSYSNTSSGAVTPGAAGDEVRVDCCLMAADGRSVVTGSSLGPPQVWDMQTGELLRIMKGDTIGSTNLHLAGNDRLLVGAVHADLQVNEYSTRKGVTNKKLQIWDYTTGRPLEMGSEETCSALCVMTGDPDKVVFGHSEKFGNATSIVVWDLLGNQPLKEMKYDGPIGNNDYINFIKLSQNDRYCVAGFTNTFDNYAEFMVFDMNLTNVNVNDPCLLRLDANPECTVILPRDEAVTGLRNGDLVVWSLRTGQPSRQLLSGSGVHAHSQEVKAVVLSEDNRYLVSASADGKLKVWDMQSERQINTLSGHSDEVWCVAISPDNDIIVSGSRDGTIRLWRMKNGSEICTFTTGVDVFYVTMSHDKGTIVALGDKFGARKLIMLQVVRTKIRRQISS